MDIYQERKWHALQEKLLDAESGGPIVVLPFSFLEAITQNFSDEQQIGRGGFGAVYKGQLPNGMAVAVKKLHNTIGILEENFQSEVACLRQAEHKNTVRFLGYCNETQRTLQEYKGRDVWADERLMLFCFEYLSKGNLSKHLTEPSTGLPWKDRYQIIRGICEGVGYLHQQRIIHMDLKPENILLDNSMVPKIADFGLSKRLSESQSRTITEHIVGTRGYLAPEFFSNQTITEITFKLDIYSLGVIIIEILIGCKERPTVDKVLESWRNMFGTSESHMLLEQVRVCAETGINCTDENPENRPDIQDIIDRLQETDISNSSVSSVASTSSAGQLVDELESMTVSSALPQQEQSALGRFYQHYRLAKEACKPMRITASMALEASLNYHNMLCWSLKLHPSSISEGALLDVHPLKLSFPYPSEKVTQCSLNLINRTDHYFAYFIRPQHQDMYTIISYNLDPMSTVALNVEMLVEQEPPPLDAGMFEILMISMERKMDLRNLEPSIGKDPQKIDDDLLKRVEELGGEVHAALLTSEICQPMHAVLYPQVISRVGFEDIRTIDVHSTKPWILVGHGKLLSIWYYEMEARTVFSLDIKDRAGKLFHMINGHLCVTSVKFIPQKEWCVAGDNRGYIHVYTCPTMNEIKSFKATGRGSVKSLAIHPDPTCSYLMSACADGVIEIWNWEMGWACSLKVQTGSGMAHATFNPMDVNTFVTSHVFGTGFIKVWSIDPSAHQPITTIECHTEDLLCHDHVFTEAAGRNHVLVLGKSTGPQIWDLQTETRLHTLSDPRCPHTAVACRPTLPLIAAGGTMSTDYDGRHPIVQLWDPTKYRLEKTVRCKSSGLIKYLGFIGSRRLVIGSENGIEVMEIFDMGPLFYNLYGSAS